MKALDAAAAAAAAAFAEKPDASDIAEEAEEVDALTGAEIDARLAAGEHVELRPRPWARAIVWRDGEPEFLEHDEVIPNFTVYLDTGWSEPARWDPVS